MIAFIPGRVRCPLAGVGARGDYESNRLVVDAPATATITGTTIALHDDRDCPPKTTIADLVWLAEGPAPFTIHLEVTKTGRAWEVDLHTHEPAKLDRDRAVYEPLEVIANGKPLVDRAMIDRAVKHVPLKRRLAAKLTAVKDHPLQSDRVLDRSIGIGALGAGSYLVRAQLTSLAKDNPRGDLVTMLRDGSWEFSLEALTDRWVPELVQRDMQLFGLEDVEVLADARRGNMRKGRVLAFRCIPGAHEIRLDDQRAPFPRALDVAREYLEFHMLGGMLAAAVR